MFDPVEAIRLLSLAEKVVDRQNDALISIFEEVFSAIATCSPALAVEIVKQMQEKLPEIQAAADERSES